MVAPLVVGQSILLELNFNESMYRNSEEFVLRKVINLGTVVPFTKPT